MIECSTNEREPSAAFFCSNHDSPSPWACSDVTTSLSPSPFTSYTAISAPPGLERVHLPKAAGWYFQVPDSAVPDSGLLDSALLDSALFDSGLFDSGLFDSRTPRLLDS